MKVSEVAPEVASWRTPEDRARTSVNLQALNMPPLPSTSSAADVAASITQRFIAARQAQSAAPFGAAEMRALFRHQMGHFRTFYEDEAALDAARAAMPLDRLHEEALAELQPGEDFFKKLALKAMHWFKHEFFQWVNAPPCDFCAAAPEQMKALGMAAPLPEELEHGASRVELYQCQVCSSHSRFPRYNNPVKLLQTRRGRCGEWANCFCLCLRALGFDARYVLDSTDHVWCEIHVEEDGGRYVHMDPCENAWDTPLVYEKGWGKKLSYIFAFTHRSVTDVIKKYSRNWDDVVTRRTKCSESTLEALVKSTNDEALNGVKDAGEIRKRRDQDIAHFEAAFRAGNADVKAEEMVGRESGSLEWRLARGELGGDDGASTGEPSSCPNPDTMDTIFEIPVRASEDDSGTMVVCNGTATFSRLHGPTPFSNHPIFSIQLTDAVNDSKGSAFALPQLPVNKSWLVEFGFRITNPRGGPVQGGADGFAFVLHGDDEAGPMALGGGGYEMGYGGLRACLAVEFDTYREYF